MSKTEKEDQTRPSSVNEKYLSALRAIGNWTTVSEWATKVGELFPDLLEKANSEAKNHKRHTTGIREIAARISSWVSTGGWAGTIEIDSSERPRRVRLLTAEAAREYVAAETEEDLEPISRSQKIKADEAHLSTIERYRIAEFEAIIGQLRSFVGLDFELEHAKALLNPDEPGEHHPDNLQLLLRSHNRSKGRTNWARFSIEEQVEYIEAVVRVQKVVSRRMGIEIQDEVIAAITQRLRTVF